MCQNAPIATAPAPTENQPAVPNSALLLTNSERDKHLITVLSAARAAIADALSWYTRTSDSIHLKAVTYDIRNLLSTAVYFRDLKTKDSL